MKKFLITYQLNDTKADYDKVSTYIKSYPKQVKMFDRVWIIISAKKAGEIRTELASAIENRGKIFVIDITNAAWGSYAIDANVTAFIKEN